MTVSWWNAHYKFHRDKSNWEKLGDEMTPHGAVTDQNRIRQWYDVFCFRASLYSNAERHFQTAPPSCKKASSRATSKRGLPLDLTFSDATRQWACRLPGPTLLRWHHSPYCDWVIWNNEVFFSAPMLYLLVPHFMKQSEGAWKWELMPW